MSQSRTATNTVVAAAAVAYMCAAQQAQCRLFVQKTALRCVQRAARESNAKSSNSFNSQQEQSVTVLHYPKAISKGLELVQYSLYILYC
jgi:hypothetical protein